jgi:DNA-binding MarR family transcriptional regulator
MTNPQPDLVAQHLRRSLGRLVRTLRRHDDDELSPTSASILFTVAREGPLTAGDIARKERLAKPSVTAAVERLVEAGLVERRSDDADRRMVWVVITSAGRRRIDARRARRTAWLASRLQHLDPTDLAVLARAADIIDGITAPVEEVATA